jgi:hypothetical protein
MSDERYCDMCDAMTDHPLAGCPGKPASELPSSTGSAKYDHDEVRCDEMMDWDCEFKAVGERRTCCVCAEHDCAEARAERAKHPKRISSNA